MSKKKYIKPPWKYDHNKDTPTNNTKLTQLYHSQLIHKNFTQLSSNAKVIYIYMLDYSNGSQTTTFPHSIYKDIVSKPTFIKCINELIEKGFIEITKNGRFTRTENEYKFISNWCNKVPS